MTQEEYWALANLSTERWSIPCMMLYLHTMNWTSALTFADVGQAYYIMKSIISDVKKEEILLHPDLS